VIFQTASLNSIINNTSKVQSKKQYTVSEGYKREYWLEGFPYCRPGEKEIDTIAACEGGIH
jgi:hypothetical protein